MGKIIGLCIGIALLVVGIVSVWRMSTPQTTPPPESSTPIQREAGFIIGVWEGKLAVFPAGALEPSRVYDVYIASLPEEEQSYLQNGVIAEDAVALAALLEDYTS